jgi:hypothetical protein
MTRWAGLCAIVAGCALFATRVSAEEGQATASPADLATLQKRLDDLEKQIASGSPCGQTCCESLCCDPCHCPGVVFGAELSFLRFHDNLGLANRYNDLEAAPRIWAGWTTAGGLGARIRWFNYQDTSSASIDERVRLYTVDLEVTDSFQLGSKWSGLLSGGVRYAENNDFLRIFGGTRYVDSGTGPVLGVELYRQVTDHFSLFAIGRESLLFGNEVFETPRRVGRSQNTLFAISEIQLGGEWRKPLNGTAYFFARSAVEAQWWGGAESYFRELNDSVGLVGGTMAVGISR